jgi:hypothetical protein
MFTKSQKTRRKAAENREREVPSGKKFGDGQDIMLRWLTQKGKKERKAMA